MPTTNNNHGVFVFCLWIYTWQKASKYTPYEIICAKAGSLFCLQWETKMLTMMPCIEIPIIRFRAEPPRENNRRGFVFASWISNRLAHHYYKAQSQPWRTTTGSLSSGLENSRNKLFSKGVSHQPAFSTTSVVRLRRRRFEGQKWKK